MLIFDIFQLLERERHVMEHKHCVRLKGAVLEQFIAFVCELWVGLEYK
jgi:hypothetical protein